MSLTDEVMEEKAWLIEKKINGNTHYLYVPCTGFLDWTGSPNKALRLARREDADMLCNIVEDAEEVKQIAFLRYVFWQGENGGEVVDESLDYQPHGSVVQECLRDMRDKSELA